MRRISITIALGLVSATLGCQSGDQATAEQDTTTAQNVAAGDSAAPAQDSVTLPPQWRMRIDPGRRPAPVTMTAAGEGFQLNTGRGSGIFWNPTDTAMGTYEVTADLRQVNAQEGHAEAYGIVFGGSNMDAENHSYYYFVIRGTGEYMVRHRAGNDVHTIADWTAHPSIRKVNASGNAANELVVRVGSDSVRFLVNGTQVQAYGKEQMRDTNGQVGLRANHRTELHVDRFDVTQPSS